MKNYSGKFCNFRKSGLAQCGMWNPDGAERCKKHVGKKDGGKKSPQAKFRGSSSWGRENGMGKSAIE